MATRKPLPRVTARIVNPAENARQPDIPMVSAWSLIGRDKDPDTGKFVLRECLTARTYFAHRADGMRPLRACVWVPGCRATGSPYISGRGSASGCGYHKESQALADAIESAGVHLFGDQYRRDATRNKDRLYFGGTGSSGYREIFEAIARAQGFRGPFLLISH